MGFNRDYEIYGDLLFQYKPTLRSIIFNYFYAKFLNLKKTKESFYVEDAKFRLPQESQLYDDIVYMAVVNKKNNVSEVIRVNSATAELLLDKHKIIPFDPKESVVKIGMKYEDGSFVDKENTENEED